MLLKITQHSTLLDFLIESLQSGVNRFTWLNNNINQMVIPLEGLLYMIGKEFENPQYFCGYGVVLA
jgi:hypothetical protein